ncbi:MFS transporter, MCP family, solute carrier family 16, member 10 [Aureobasidium pullulans]|uniref:MFS transporter, MCP family, solute carrier family 16, member 10 n=1 Tax=Aureobasidium pullulans TaxID=5580 RepID=A0AB74JIT7_AURPU|nr:MFS transporter, MCP family, solute carrier family 16, member 10 [Aureobasidium pullulans]THX62853.1 MFS transporter, MCP family, solute carrier family 16, member 10 [Aureobasidium pullulans]
MAQIDEKKTMPESVYSETEKGSASSSPDLTPTPSSWSEKSIREPHEEGIYEPETRPQSTDIERVASNVLNRIASRVTTHSLAEPGPPPDGGFKAWLQCAMAWLVVFCTWGYVNSFGTFQAYYSTNLGETASTISWIGSIQVWVLFFLGTFAGRAMDAGYFVPTFAVGTVFQLIGIFMTSLSTKYWQLFLAQGVCTGIGSGILFTPAMALLSTYFSSHKGIAVALATTGNSAGGAIFPLIARQLLPQIGFGWTIRVLGLLNLVCLCTAGIAMKPRLPPRKSGPLVDTSAFKEIEYMLFSIGMCFHMASLYFVNYYISSYGRDILGFSYSNSVTLLIILNVVGIPARVLVGHLADRYLGALNTLIPVLFYVNVLAFCWMGVNSQTSLYVFVSFYGLGLASFQSLIPTTVARMTKDISKVGTRMGMVFTFLSFASLVGPPIGGALVSAGGHTYIYAQAWAGASAAVGTALVVASRVYAFGWKLKVKC